MLTKEQFLEYIRDALNYLYDPNRLRQSPLAALFGVADRPDTSARLRRILTEAIASLEPNESVPSQSRAWRIYDLLFCRYVQQLSGDVTAEQLGIGIRHMRREQHAALEGLAYQLWNQFDLGTSPPSEPRKQDVREEGEAHPTAIEELAWLRNATLEQPTDLRATLSGVLTLVQPMARQQQMHFDISVPDGIMGLAVHPVALNQMLLNLLSAAIAQTRQSHIHLSAHSQRWEIEIRVRAGCSTGDKRPMSDEDLAGLDMVDQIAGLCGGRLTWASVAAGFSATLVLPAFEQLPVLIIDDNADTLQLLQHYMVGTRYRLVGTRDPDQAFALIEPVSPQIIVLDVMMPQVDGWKVLGRLRQHPLTSGVPIIVCTILSQERLAYLLGAKEFLHKPVTQEAFLAALDRAVTEAPESR